MRKRPYLGQLRSTISTRNSRRRRLVLETLEDRRLLVAGTLDTSFGTGGIQRVDLMTNAEQAGRVVVQPDGKLVTAGSGLASTGNWDFVIARFLIDGGLDTSFGTGGKAVVQVGTGDDFSESLVVQPDGKILVVGSTLVGSNADVALIRLTTNGALDTTFGTQGKVITPFGSGNETGRELALAANGDIFVAGDTIQTNQDMMLLKYTSSGVLDSSFDVDGKLAIDFGPGEAASSLAVQADGNIAVSGYRYNGTDFDFAMARVTSTGSWDNTFGTSGKMSFPVGTGADYAHALVMLPSGDFVLAGFTTTGTKDNLAIAKVRGLNGQVDTTFGTSGKTLVSVGAGNDHAQSIVLQPDGKLLIGGYTTNGSSLDMATVRLTANGALDNLFDSDGKMTLAVVPQNDLVYSMALQGFDKAILLGTSTNGSKGQTTLARVHIKDELTGGPDATFAGTGKVSTPVSSANEDVGRAIVAQADGKLVVAGYVQVGAGNTEFSAVRYNLNGALDTTFATSGKYVSAFSGLDEQGKAIAFQSDSKLVIAGDVSNGSNLDFGLIRLNANGSLDTGFGVGGLRTTAIGAGADSANAVALDSAGRILVAGSTFNGSNLDFAVARYTTTGTLDTTYGTGGKFVFSIGSGDDVINGIVLQPDGRLLVVGSSIQAGLPDFAVARLDANGALDTTFGSDGKLTFSFGTTSDIAYAVALLTDGRILIGGSSRLNGKSDFDFALARLNSNGSFDTSFDGDGKATATVGTADDEAYAIALQANGQIVLTGYATAGSSTDSAIVRFNNNGTLDAAFDGDGQATYQLSTGVDLARGVALLNDGSIAIAGSTHNGSNLDFSLTVVVGNSAIDTTYGTSGRTITNLSGNDRLNDVAIQANGQIVVVGSQTHATRAEDWSVVRYNADGTLDTAFNNSFQLSSPNLFFTGFDQATGVVIQPADQKILVAGTTTVSGGQSQFTVARFLPTGVLDTTFISAVGFVRTSFGTSQAVANAIALDSLGRIVVAGQVGTGSLFDFAVVRYLSNGTIDTSFGNSGKVVFPFSDGDDRALSLTIQSNDSIVVAGYNDTGSNLDGAVIRLLSTGAIDNSFGTSGKVAIDFANNNDVFNSIVPYLSGGFVVGGFAVTSGNVADRDFALARLTSNGALDNSFDSDGKQTTRITGGNDSVSDVQVLANGAILASGDALTSAGTRMAVSRYLTTGALDNTFGNSGVMQVASGRSSDSATSATLAPLDKLILAGVASNGSNFDFATVRIVHNAPPTKINLSSTSITEGQPIGTLVGRFATDDRDASDTFSYELVNGTGSTDNPAFQISGNSLTATAVFNFNTKNSYSIRVRTADSSGAAFDKVFSISITPSFGAAQLLQSIAPPNTANSTTGAQFGRSVAANANYFVVGASGVDVGSTIDAGQAFVYNPNSTAITLTQTLNNPALSNTDQMGYSGAITNDVVALGAPFDRVGTIQAGRAMLFNAATGTLIATLDNPAAVNSGKFGIAVAAANGLIAVGAPGNNVGATGSGSVYVYDSAGTLQRIINNPSPFIGAAFGTSVDLNATTLAIGSTASGGKVYLFDVSTGNLLRTLDNPNLNSSDRFGESVAISESMLAVGAFGGIPTGNTLRSGRVFLYDLSNGSLLRTIDPPTQAANDQFGFALDFESNYLVIGAPLTDINGSTDVGAAYVYNAATGSLIGGLSNPLPSTNDQFGYAVALSGPRILVGTYLEDSKASNQGYVHLFSMAAPPFTINLSSTSVAENVSTGTTVAVLSTAPANNLPITYALVPGTGGVDNASFQIVGNQLQTNSPIDFETRTAYSVLVEATDTTGKKVQRIVSISVNNVNEAPNALLISNNHLAEDQAVGTLVAALSTLDPDALDTFTYSLPIGQADNNQFTIVGNQLRTNSRFDYETKDDYTVSIRSQDSGGFSITWAYLITIDDLNPPAPPANPLYDLRNVVDLNNTIQSSTPSSPVELAGVTYFAGNSPTFGRELYRSDRTLAGTSVVKDLILAGDANPESLTVFNGHVYFLSSYTQFDGLGNPGPTGFGLWRTDGTAVGTTLVKDLTTLGYTGGSNFKPMQVVNSRLVFTLAFGFNEDLWSTDGTAAGTVLLTNFVAPFGASPFSTLLNTGSQLFINLYVDQNTGSHNLWRTDGTVAGTRQLRSVQQTTPTSEAFDGSLVALGGIVYFSSTDASGTELWRTDGSIAGTSMVKDINLGGAPPPSSNSGNPAGMAIVNGMLMFSADDGINGRELWKSDGTAAGTVTVKNIRSGGSFSSSMTSSNASRNSAAWNGKYYFVANDGVNGFELWNSDGTDAGTTMLSNVGSNEFEGALPRRLFALTSRLLFATDVIGFAGSQLWSTDGTVAGTVFIADPDGTSPVNNFADSAFAVGNQLFFNANNATLGNELWVSDGTAVGTLALRDLATGSASGLTGILAASASGVYFQGNNGVVGTELGYSNGTATGTYLLDVARGTPPSDVREVVSNGSILYVATGQGLYKVDDADHTSIFLTNKIATQLTVVGSSVFFVADSTSQSNVLWRSNGTTSGTVPVTTFAGASILDPQMLTNFNGALYYSSTTVANGRELWSSDSQQFEFGAGATNGNVQRIMPVGSKLYVVANDKLYVKDAATYAYLLDVDASTLMPWENVLYFGGFSIASGYELWRTEGTPASTYLVADIVTGPNSSNPGGGVIAGNSPIIAAGEAIEAKLVFRAQDATGAMQLFATDGTTAGTIALTNEPLVTLAGGITASLAPVNLRSVDGRVYFEGYRQDVGRELWISNGTPAGTKLVKDLRPGASPAVVGDPLFVSAYFNLQEMTSYHGRLFFRTTSSADGTELWTSDGTIAGSGVAVDSLPGISSGNAKNLVVLNDRLYLSANTFDFGIGTQDIAAGELFRLNEAPFAAPVQQTTAQNLATQIKLRGIDRDADTLSYEIVTAPAHRQVRLAGRLATYTPSTGYIGSDTFTYRVFDGSLVSDDVQVEIGVLANNARQVSLATTDATVNEKNGVYRAVIQLNTAASENLLIPYSIGYSRTGERIDSDVLISAGQTTAEIIVPLRDDNIYTTAPESIEITLKNNNVVPLGSNTEQLITLVENDLRPIVQFVDSQRTITESDAAYAFEVVLNSASDQQIAVAIDVAGFVAIQGTDFVSALTTNLTFEPGQLRKRVMVKLNEDTLGENRETIFAQISTVSNVTVTSDPDRFRSLIYIADNDASVINVSPAVTWLTEGDQVTLQATRTGGNLNVPLSVPVNATSATAVATDYQLSTTAFQFLAGATIATLTVTAAEDSTAETTEDVTISVPPNAGYVLGTNTQSFIGLYDNDRPIISLALGNTNVAGVVSPKSIAEKYPSGAGNWVIDVVATLSSASSQLISVPVTINSGLIDGYATIGQDFQFNPDNFVFAPGVTQVVRPLTILDDSLIEKNELLQIALAPTSSQFSLRKNGIKNDEGLVTQLEIRNNDYGVKTEAPTNVKENAGLFTFTLDIGAPAAGGASMSILFGGTLSSNEFQVPGMTNSGVNVVLFQIGEQRKTFTVNFTNDALFEGTETFSITAFNAVDLLTTVVNIQDDDAPPSISFGASVTGFGLVSADDPGSLQIPIQVSGTVATDTLIKIEFGGSAKYGQDFYTPGSLSIGQFVLPANKTIIDLPIFPIDNGLVDGDKTLEVTIVSAGQLQLPAALPKIRRTIVDTSRPSAARIRAASEELARRVLNHISEQPGSLASSLAQSNVGMVEHDRSSPVFGGNTPLDGAQPGQLLIGGGRQGSILGAHVFFDGNLNGMRDYLDANANGRQDASEPSEPDVATDLDGSFAMTIPAAFDQNADGRITASEGRHVLYGGTDVSTGLAWRTQMTTPIGLYTITPTSTVIERLMSRRGLSYAAAAERVGQALELGAYDFVGSDSFYRILTGDSSAAVLYTRQVMLSSFTLLAASLFSSKSGESLQLYADRTLDAIVDSLALSSIRIDLANSTLVSQLLQSINSNLTMPLTSQQIADAAALINLGVDRLQKLRLSDYADPNDFLDAATRIKKAIHGSMTDDFVRVGAGTETFANLITKYAAPSTPNFDSIAAGQFIGQVVTPVLGVTDAAVIEGDSGSKTLEFTVQLLGRHTQSISVNYQTIDGSAVTAAGDYAISSGTLNWSAGDNSPRTLQVTVDGDTNFEPDEYLQLLLSGATNAVIRVQEGLGFIINNDALSTSELSGSNSYIVSHDLADTQIRNQTNAVATGMFTNPFVATLQGSPTDINSFRFDFSANSYRSDTYNLVGGTNIDSLTFRAGRFASIVHQISTSSNGKIILNSFDSKTIDVPWNSINDVRAEVSSVDEFVLHLPENIASVIIEDADAVSTGMLRVRSASGEFTPIDFTNPNIKLQIVRASTNTVVQTLSTDPGFTGAIEIVQSGVTLSNSQINENLPANSLVGLFQSQDPLFGNAFALSFVAGDGDQDNASFILDSGALKANASFNFESKSIYSIRIRAVGQAVAGGTIDRAFTISIADLAELQQSVQIADGTLQRSQVKQLVVDFDNDVIVDADAFLVQQRTIVNGVPVFNAVTTQFVLTTLPSGDTRATLNFSGALTRGSGALVDGYYQLTILAAKVRIRSSGLAFDGDGNGVAGGDHVLGAQEADNFFALYGDTNGDGVVGVAEFGQFRTTFGKNSSAVGYNQQFDYEGDNSVGVSDFGQFRSRFGKPKLTY